MPRFPPSARPAARSAIPSVRGALKAWASATSSAASALASACAPSASCARAASERHGAVVGLGLRSRSEEVAGGEEVVERRGRAKLGEAKPAAGREQPACLHRRRELLGEAVALIGRLGGLELPALGERLEQHGEGDGGVDAGRAGAGLERDACVRLGVGEVADAEMNKGAVAGEPEHVRERAEPAGIGQRFVESRAAPRRSVPRTRARCRRGRRTGVGRPPRAAASALRRARGARGARPSPRARSPSRPRPPACRTRSSGTSGSSSASRRRLGDPLVRHRPRCPRRTAPRRARRPRA